MRPCRARRPAPPVRRDGGGHLVGDACMAFGPMPRQPRRTSRSARLACFGPEVAGRTAHRPHQQAGRSTSARGKPSVPRPYVVEMAVIARRDRP